MKTSSNVKEERERSQKEDKQEILVVLLPDKTQKKGRICFVEELEKSKMNLLPVRNREERVTLMRTFSVMDTTT